MIPVSGGHDYLSSINQFSFVGAGTRLAPLDKLAGAPEFETLHLKRDDSANITILTSALQDGLFFILATKAATSKVSSARPS